jgi:antitoxin ParD1/3/4
MNITLPNMLRDFVDQQVALGSYSTPSEYVCELIRRDQDRLRLRGLLLEGAQSPLSSETHTVYFRGLRGRVVGRKPAKRRT